MDGRERTIRIWESAWGREGLWCTSCRRSTPVEQLLLEPTARAVLACESCGEELRTGPSWLTHQPLPHPRRPAYAWAEG
jgi:hypothetical protein